MQRRSTTGVRTWLTTQVLTGLALGCLSSAVMAQGKTETKQYETKDGVYITATFWPSRKPSRDAPVVMLLHMERQNQRDWFPVASRFNDPKPNDRDLASKFQKAGMAVVTFDFRGHGESCKINPKRYTEARGDSISERDVFGRGADVADLLNDVIAVKEQLLIEQNNAGRLNIKRLGVVGAGPMGCYVAMEFAKSEFANSRVPGDLQALVLINPATNFRGKRTPNKLGDGAENLPILIISSDARSSRRNAESLARMLGVPGPDDPAKPTNRKNSILFHVKSRNEGTKLLEPPVEALDWTIFDNLYNRLVVDADDTSWEPKRTGTFGSRKTN